MKAERVCFVPRMFIVNGANRGARNRIGRGRGRSSVSANDLSEMKEAQSQQHSSERAFGFVVRPSVHNAAPPSILHSNFFAVCRAHGSFFLGAEIVYMS